MEIFKYLYGIYSIVSKYENKKLLIGSLTLPFVLIKTSNRVQNTI